MKQKIKLNKDAKIAVVLIGAFLVVLCMYAVNAFYLSHNGTLETEFILNYNENSSLAVNGFAVRDESKIVDGKNTCLLSKNDNYVYVPVISDSENVSKKGVIALAFLSETEANAYVEEQELREKLASIKEIERSEELSYSNILFLNSQLNLNVSGYLSCVGGSDVSDIDSYLESITNNITSKQIATGEDLDYKTIINDYNKKIKELKSSYKIVDKITSPYAGYFVSGTDGYEDTFSFATAEKKKVEKGQGEKLVSSAPSAQENIYGKVILQHTWYYIFDVDIDDSSSFKNGYWVSVSFDELGLKDIDMQIYDISELENGKVTVTLKCTSMNEELSKIRKETAKITLSEFDGFKISNEALTENEDGITGVYAIVGNIMKFSPVEVEFYGDGYVVAVGKKVLRDEKNEKFGYYHVLRQYDKIIVKGMNLKDGTIVE
ncbi:MAG: hypothetical protein IJW86_02015 [Clostridia bacterium]|nr:hypothetical protein [Clostridia bacterium]